MTQYTPDQARKIANRLFEWSFSEVSDALRSLADQLEQASSHPKSIEAVATMPQHWSVSVNVDGSDIVSIGHNWLSGSRPLEERDEQTILGAAQHLLSFIGYGLPASSFDPDKCAAPVVSAPVASEWMPIESAPKDGRSMLLGYFNSAEKWRTMRGQWMSQDEIDENWEDPEYGVPGWYETVVESDDIPNCWFTEPTHWMPLPPAPGAQAAPVAQLSEPPEGWKLVPIEPTEKMLRAIEDAGPSNYAGMVEGNCRTIYAAFLAAAPTTPKGTP